MAKGTDDASEDPYYIVLQLASGTNSSNTTNATMPCMMPSDEGYIPCPCNVSETTATNITYVCYDVSFICPSGTRRLEILEDESEFSQGEDDDDLPRRSLAGDDGDDAGLEETQSTSMSDYGALLASLLKAASSVLSQNPFAIDLSKARDTLIMIACLLCGLIGGCTFFAKWDTDDRNALLYLKGYVFMSVCFI